MSLVKCNNENSAMIIVSWFCLRECLISQAGLEWRRCVADGHDFLILLPPDLHVWGRRCEPPYPVNSAGKATQRLCVLGHVSV